MLTITNNNYAAGVPEKGFRFFYVRGAFITTFPNDATYTSRHRNRQFPHACFRRPHLQLLSVSFG